MCLLLSHVAHCRMLYYIRDGASAPSPSAELYDVGCIQGGFNTLTSLFGCLTTCALLTSTTTLSSSSSPSAWPPPSCTCPSFLSTPSPFPSIISPPCPCVRPCPRSLFPPLGWVLPIMVYFGVSLRSAYRLILNAVTEGCRQWCRLHREHYSEKHGQRTAHRDTRTTDSAQRHTDNGQHTEAHGQRTAHRDTRSPRGR